MSRWICCAWLLVGLSLVWPAGARAAEDGLSDSLWEMAIRDESTSPYYLFLTVVDDRTGQVSKGCTMAPFLVGAILRERWGSAGGTRLAEAQRIAIANKSRVFHFSSAAALANIVPPMSRSDPQACIEVQQGRPARQADRTGKTILGPVVEEPAILECLPATDLRRDNPAWDGFIISLLIGPDGAVKETRINHGTGVEELDEALRRAYSSCRFTPQTVDGQPAPAPAWTRIWMGGAPPWSFPDPKSIADITHSIAASIDGLGLRHTENLQQKVIQARVDLVSSLSDLSSIATQLLGLLRQLKSRGAPAAQDPSLWDDLDDTAEELRFCLERFARVRGPLDGPPLPSSAAVRRGLFYMQAARGAALPRLRIEAPSAELTSRHHLDAAAVEAYIQGLGQIAAQADAAVRVLGAATP